jgi:hypothetical protein
MVSPEASLSRPRRIAAALPIFLHPQKNLKPTNPNRPPPFFAVF